MQRLANGADLHPECEAGWLRLVPPPDLERAADQGLRDRVSWKARPAPSSAIGVAAYASRMANRRRQARARAAAERAP